MASALPGAKTEVLPQRLGRVCEVRKNEKQSEIIRVFAAMAMGALLRRRAACFSDFAISVSEKRIFGGFDCLCHTFLAFGGGDYRIYGIYGACRAKQKKTAA